MGNIISLPPSILGWNVIKDGGMVETTSINNVSGNKQRKRLVFLECPNCKIVKRFFLGNLKYKKNKTLRCLSPICKKGNLSQRYKGMVNRCYNHLSKSYETHGGLGIGVCKEWLNNPYSFIIWAKKSGFKDNLFLDRINNDLDYSPENCRWVTPSDSALNRGIFKNNTTGYTGITHYKHPNSSKHRFQIRVGSMQRGKLKAYSDTLEEALLIRDVFIKRLHLEKYYQ